MKQKKCLHLLFTVETSLWSEIPEIVEIADKSSTVEDFKAGILRLLETCRIENELARRRGSKFDSYLIMMGRMFMNCLRDRICQYRLFGCFMSF